MLMISKQSETTTIFDGFRGKLTMLSSPSQIALASKEFIGHFSLICRNQRRWENLQSLEQSSLARPLLSGEFHDAYAWRNQQTAGGIDEMSGLGWVSPLGSLALSRYSFLLSFISTILLQTWLFNSSLTDYPDDCLLRILFLISHMLHKNITPTSKSSAFRLCHSHSQ